MDKKHVFETTLVCAGDNLSYIYCDHILIATGNKYGSQNQYFPLVMDITKSIVVKGITCSDHHAAVWDYNGRAYTWGNAMHGRLGHPLLAGVFKEDDLEKYPRKVLSLGEKSIFMMAAGEKFTVYLDSEGKIGFFGRLLPIQSSLTPDMQLIAPIELKAMANDEIKIDTKFNKIVAGKAHCLASDTYGKLYSWGVNVHGDLGTYLNTISTPTMIKDLEDYLVIDFACGEDFSVVILDTSGSISEDKIYSDFKYNSITNVKNKLLEASQRTRAALAKQASVRNIPVGSSKKLSNMTREQLANKVEKFIDSTDLVGFASLKEGSKRMVMSNLINSFLEDEMCLNQFNTDYARLTQICESMGTNFEEIFYQKIMQDPTVRKEIADRDLQKNILVELR